MDQNISAIEYLKAVRRRRAVATRMRHEELDEEYADRGEKSPTAFIRRYLDQYVKEATLFPSYQERIENRDHEVES
jgi:hypothetical protein